MITNVDDALVHLVVYDADIDVILRSFHCHIPKVNIFPPRPTARAFSEKTFFTP